MNTPELLIAACAGALLPELIRIGKGPTDGVFKTVGYWIQLVAQLIAAALAAEFLNPTDLKAAFTLGFTLPQTLTRLAAAPTPTAPTSPPPGGVGPQKFNPRIWWSR